MPWRLPRLRSPARPEGMHAVHPALAYVQTVVQRAARRSMCLQHPYTIGGRGGSERLLCSSCFLGGSRRPPARALRGRPDCLPHEVPPCVACALFSSHVSVCPCPCVRVGSRGVVLGRPRGLHAPRLARRTTAETATCSKSKIHNFSALLFSPLWVWWPQDLDDVALCSHSVGAPTASPGEGGHPGPRSVVECPRPTRAIKLCYTSTFS